MHPNEDDLKEQLRKIGETIGYGRSIQLLGQLWDDMLQLEYSIASRHQESMFRRTDIERIEAGLPIGRKVVYFQKRGRKEQITAWTPIDAEIPNVARIVSDTLLYGRAQSPEGVVMDALERAAQACDQQADGTNGAYRTACLQCANAVRELRDEASAVADEYGDEGGTCETCGGDGGDRWNDNITPCDQCGGTGLK